MEKKIEDGCTLWARQTIESEIFYDKPDKWFKIWFYLVNKVNHEDNKRFKRGECFTKYEWIANATGASKDQIKHCIEYLKHATMLATQKATRGMLVSIINYNTYQNLTNYQSHIKRNLKATQKPHRSHTINKNGKNGKNDKKERKKEPSTMSPQDFLEKWNKKFPSKPFFVKGLSDKRKEHLRTRLQEPLFVEKFDLIMDKILDSPFLLGEKPSKSHPNFKANFDWVIRNNENYLKILEDKYNDPLDIFSG